VARVRGGDLLRRLSTMGLELGPPAEEGDRSSWRLGRRGETGGRQSARGERRGRERAVGMRKDVNIPEMQHARATSAKCRLRCDNCWRGCSWFSICILQMEIGMG
jgi:hypothetical protein